MKWWGIGATAIGLLLLVSAAPVSADASLKVLPLQYEENLQKGERKRGFIDVTNPLPQAVKVQFSVEGFRQIDNNGNLAFYPDERLRQGVQLDYDEYEIPAQKGLRLYFVIDGTKLPTGDVFAVIFARTMVDAQGGGSPSVRIGSLLIVQNGTPQARQAQVTALETPLFHVGETISGYLAIKNSAPSNTSNGFFPMVSLSVWPFGTTTTIKGPLVFAGNTRQINFNQSSNQLGIYKVTASYGDSRQERWVILVTGVWRWICLTVVVLGALAMGIIIASRHQRQTSRKR